MILVLCPLSWAEKAPSDMEDCEAGEEACAARGKSMMQTSSLYTAKLSQNKDSEGPPVYAEALIARQQWQRDAVAKKNPNVTDAFNDIANSGYWGSGESVSGPGSEIAVTATVRQCLGEWLQKYNVKTFVDCPCGDANWQSHIPGIAAIEYHGFDIADLPLQLARAAHANTTMKFDHLDLTKEVPPYADVIMVRDVVQHLPIDLGRKMLVNAKTSGARYIAVTSFTDGQNTDIEAGKFYANDVHAEPFLMPQPIERCDNYDGAWFPTDFLLLIELSKWNP